MMRQASAKMLVRSTQLSAATHGDPSRQASQPSAQGRHSKVSVAEYRLGWDCEGKDITWLQQY